MKIVKVNAPRRMRCVSCGETIRNCEPMFQVQQDGSPVRGEHYCVGCERIAHVNACVDNEDDGERGLRERETYAAYQAAGCTSQYWTDRDAGY